MDNKEDKVAKFRNWNLALAEAVDAHRLIPRVIILGYSILTGYVIDWYMHIEPIILKNNCHMEAKQMICDITGMIGPSTQQAALVTAVIGAAAVIIGFYNNSGRDWHKPVSAWFKKDKKKEVSEFEKFNG